MNKIKFLLIMACLAISTTSNAMHLNLSLGKDIYLNNDSITIHQEIFYKVNDTSPNSVLKIDFYPYKPDLIMNELIVVINEAIATMNPIDNSVGKHSTFSFDIINASKQTISPASCQNIQAKAVLNVEINEAGCIVS
jgi:hypothetical protein